MRIQRYDLLCATDKMLKTLGLKRTRNAGWLKDALRMEFPAAKCAEFFWIKTQRLAAGKGAQGKRQRETPEQFANDFYERHGRATFPDTAIGEYPYTLKGPSGTPATGIRHPKARNENRPLDHENRPKLPPVCEVFTEPGAAGAIAGLPFPAVGRNLSALTGARQVGSVRKLIPQPNAEGVCIPSLSTSQKRG